MAAAFFLFLGAKKLPKNPLLLLSDSESRDGLAARGGTDGGSTLPVFGSTCCGLLALCRSLTIAIAYRHG